MQRNVSAPIIRMDAEQSGEVYLVAILTTELFIGRWVEDVCTLRYSAPDGSDHFFKARLQSHPRVIITSRDDATVPVTGQGLGKRGKVVDLRFASESDKVGDRFATEWSCGGCCNVLPFSCRTSSKEYREGWEDWTGVGPLTFLTVKLSLE
jgi:hypothetical protein